MDGQTITHFFSLPSTLSEWVIGVGVLVVGGFNLFNMFSSQKKTLETESDERSDRLVKILKEQVEALEKKVNEQEVILRETNVKLEALISENHILRDVLQGRDENTRKYQEEGVKAFGTADKVLEIVKRTDDNVNRLMSTNVLETKTTKIKKI